MIRFKVLQLDPGTEYLLPIAKQKASRLIEAGEHIFNRTWLIDGKTVVARCADLLGDFIVRIAIAGGGVVINQLARGYNWRQPINFKLDSTPIAKAPWYERIAPVVLPALGNSVQFELAGLTAGQTVATVNQSGALSILGPTRLGSVKTLLQTFRGHVLSGHEAATRYWFKLLADNMSLVFGGRTIPTDPNEMLVSLPDSTGNFFVLWGTWGSIPGAFDPASAIPQQVSFDGVAVSINDLLLQAPHAVKLAINFDAAVPGGGYVGPKLIDYRRLDLGSFPLHARDLIAPFRYRYRPDQPSDRLGAYGSPYAISYFDKEGDALGAGAEKWTYTFERHTLTSAGAILVQTITLPKTAAFNQQTTHGGFTGTFSIDYSAYTADMAFFDGTAFVKFGDIAQSASSIVEVSSVATSFVPGTVAVETALPHTSLAGKFAPSEGFDFFIREIGLTYSAINGAMTLADMGAVRSSDSADSSVVVDGSDRPRLPLRMGGPAWGAYQYQVGSTSAFAETGFNAMGFGPPAILNVDSIASVPTMSAYRPPRGVFWYRTNGSMGVFIYAVLADIEADSLKYRNIAQKVTGFQQQLNPDGSVKSSDPGWEDPSAILARIVQKVRVDVNNFGTPAMIPWLHQLGSADTDLVIVDG